VPSSPFSLFFVSLFLAFLPVGARFIASSSLRRLRHFERSKPTLFLFTFTSCERIGLRSKKSLLILLLSAGSLLQLFSPATADQFLVYAYSQGIGSAREG